MCVDWFIFLFVVNLVSLASSEEIWQQCGRLPPDLFAIPANGGYYESIGCNYSQAVGLTSANELLNPATVLISEGNVVSEENSLSILIPNILGSPLHITISKMNFFAGSVLKVVGALPPQSTLSITNNYFELNSVFGGLSMEAFYILMEVRNRVNISINDNEFVFNVDSAAIRFNMYRLLVSNHSGLTISRNTGTIPNSPVSSEMFSLVKFWSVGISSEISSSIVIEGNTLEGGAGARVCTICFAPQSSQTINVTSNSSFIIASNTLGNSSAIMTSAVEFISASALFLECTENGTFIISQNTVIDIEGSQWAHPVVWKYQEISMLVATSSTMSMSNNVAERLRRIENGFGLYLACRRFYADVTVSSTLRFDGNRLAAVAATFQASVVFLNVLDTLTFNCRTSSEIAFSNNSAHSAQLPSGSVSVVFVFSQFYLIFRSMSDSPIAFSNNTLIASTSATAICVALAVKDYSNNQSTTATVATFQRSRITMQRNTIIHSTATLSLRVIVWDFGDLLTIHLDASTFLVQNNSLLNSSSSSLTVVVLHGGSLSVTADSAAIFDVSSNHASSSYAGEIFVVRILSDSVSLITVTSYSVLSVSGNSVMQVSSLSIITGVLLLNFNFTISEFASVSLSNNSLLDASCSVATVLVLYTSSPAHIQVLTGSSFAADNNTGCGLTSDSIHGAFMYFRSSLSIRVSLRSTLSVSRNFVLDSVAQELAVASIVTAQLFYGTVVNLSKFSFDQNMLRNVTSQSASISGITSLTQSTLTVIEASTVSFNDNCANNLTAAYLYVVGFIAAHLQYSVESSSHFELKRNTVEGCNLMSGSLFCVLFKAANRLQLNFASDSQLHMTGNAILASVAKHHFILLGFQCGIESSSISIAFRSQLIVEGNTIVAAIASAALHMFLFNGSGFSSLSSVRIISNSQLLFGSNSVFESSSDIETVMIRITSINSLLVSSNSSLRVTDSNIAGIRISAQAQLFVVLAQSITVNDSSSMSFKNCAVLNPTSSAMAAVIGYQVSDILVDANSHFLITQIQTTSGIVSLTNQNAMAGAIITIHNFSTFNLTYNSAYESSQNYRIDLILTQIRIQLNSHLIVKENDFRQSGHNNGSVVAFGQVVAASPNCRLIIADNKFRFVSSQPQRCPPEAITISKLSQTIPGPQGHQHLISNNQFSCSFVPTTDVCAWMSIGTLLMSNLSISQNQFTSKSPFKVVISTIQSVSGVTNIPSSFIFSLNTIAFTTTRELANFTFLSVTLLYIRSSWLEISDNTVWATNSPLMFLLLEVASVRGQLEIHGCGNKVNGMTLQGNELITPASIVGGCTITVTNSITIPSPSLTRMLLTHSAEVEDSISMRLITNQAPRTATMNVVDTEVDESEIIPVPVPAGTSAVVSVAASALGGVAAAVDVQAIATIGLVACAQQDPAKPHGDLRALSIVALDNTCEGVLQGSSIALLLATLASMASVAVAHLILKRRRVLDERSTPPSPIFNAFALVRSPQLFLTLMVYFMNSYAVCGLELARGPGQSMSLRAAGGLAFAVPVAVVVSFPVLTYLFASRRLLSVQYSSWPQPLCWVGAFTLPSYALDPALQTDKLFGCVFGSYRRLGCLWSLSSHISFMAGLPMIVASGQLCQPLFALSASLYFGGAVTILVFRPRRVVFADILHCSMLIVNGLAAVSATELAGSTASSSSAGALSLEHIGTVVTVITAIRLTHSVAGIVFGVINRRGIVSGVETLDLHDDEQATRSPQFGWTLSIHQSHYTGFLWPASASRVSLDLQDAEPALLLVELLAVGEPSFSMPLASPPPIGTPTTEPTQVTQEAVVLPQAQPQRAAFEVASTELYFTEEEKFRRELAMEYASRQIAELSLTFGS